VAPGLVSAAAGSHEIDAARRLNDIHKRSHVLDEERGAALDLDLARARANVGFVADKHLAPHVGITNQNEISLRIHLSIDNVSVVG
jgi:hypothetical protein